MTFDSRIWRAKRPITIGYSALTLLVFGLGGWAATTNISGAVVTNGIIAVANSQQVVQHPNGGVISEVLVDNGDIVEAGDVLIRLDSAFFQSELTVITERLIELAARKARLLAERDGADSIAFNESALSQGPAHRIGAILEGQNSLFVARKITLANEEALLAERTNQIEAQIIGAQAQRDASRQQSNLISEQLVDELVLLGKGVSKLDIVRKLRRELVVLEGKEAALVASIAEARARIAKIEIERLRLRANRREEATRMLRDLEYYEIELRETQQTLTETVQRLDVRAPASGAVHGLQFHTRRAVVGAAEAILYIIPQNSPLVVTTRIPGFQIDQVHLGQKVNIQLSAFATRTTPTLFGEVVNVSPDAFIDKQNGGHYYEVKIALADDGLATSAGLDILPGMPVVVFLKSAERTPLEYLTKPFADYFRKAFRE